MAYESEPTADSPRPGPQGDGGMHDASTRSAAPRDAGASPALSAPLLSGAVFGHYAIEAVLGEGGMGVVYRARQERPAREVALKIIRPGLASSQALRRFELEAEILGRLQHPGIAQVFEAGTTPEGQPFFAMELVHGESLIRYADFHELTTRERLELFAKVCEAVQHAHTKGVIHRDLKPVNILIDASGQPKILDFGVARVTQHDVQAVTIQTDLGQIIGTVPYMSPEQIEGDPANLDTRSDVYALGVILYELLTGRMPYDLSKKLIHEAARIIQEDEPTRLSSINRALRGDIETIALKALEKDRSRRYQAASDLGSDITRFLRSEPISARPASRGYQLQKFAKRNKALVGGVVAAFVLLALGLAGTSYGLVRAEANANLARAEAARAVAAEAETKKRADELQQVSDFQSTMLGQIDPTTAGVRLTEDVNRRFAEAIAKAGGSEESHAAQSDAFRQQWLKVNATDAAMELIDQTILSPAVKAIDSQFRDQPLVDAQLRQVLADRYRGIGLFDAALPLQERALETRRRVLGDEHPDTLASINNMGGLLQAQGNLDEAEPYMREALEKCRRVLGEEHPDSLISMGNLGLLLKNQGKLGEAEVYLRESLDKKRRVLGEEHPETLMSVSNLGFLLSAQGKLSEAEGYYREALEKRRRVLGEEHPDTLTSIGNMGQLLLYQGKFKEAEAYSREALEKFRRVLGEEHPETLVSIGNMGLLLQCEGKLNEAEAYYRDALEKFRRVLGEDHPDTMICIGSMGDLLQSQGKWSAAEPFCREALEKQRRVLGEEHPDTLASIESMGNLLQAQGKLSEAEQYRSEALEKKRRLLGEDHPETLTSIINMGALLNAQGKPSEAELYMREALEKCRRMLGDEHPDTLSAIVNLGNLLLAQHKFIEAVGLLASAEPAARSVFTESNSLWLGRLLINLGKARAGLKEFAAAEANLLEAQSIFVATRGSAHKDTRDCTQALVDLYVAWDGAEPGKGYDVKAGEWRAKLEESAGGAAK